MKLTRQLLAKVFLGSSNDQLAVSVPPTASEDLTTTSEYLYQELTLDTVYTAASALPTFQVWNQSSAQRQNAVSKLETLLVTSNGKIRLWLNGIYPDTAAERTVVPAIAKPQTGLMACYMANATGMTSLRLSNAAAGTVHVRVLITGE